MYDIYYSEEYLKLDDKSKELEKKLKTLQHLMDNLQFVTKEMLEDFRTTTFQYMSIEKRMAKLVADHHLKIFEKITIRKMNEIIDNTRDRVQKV